MQHLARKILQTFVIISGFLLLSACEETKSKISKDKTLSEVSLSTVTIDGETHTFSDSQTECRNPFNKGINAVVFNEKMSFELSENTRTSTWHMFYNIPLGNHKYIEHAEISLDITNEDHILKGTGIVKQNNKPEIKYTISFNINCTKGLR